MKKMNKATLFTAVCIAAIAMAGCNGKKVPQQEPAADSTTVTVPDTALYGVVSEATTMHTLVITTDEGKPREFFMDHDSLSEVLGGLFSGDRISLLLTQTENGPSVGKALNLTTLLGKWTSLDRNFELKEDGVVESSVKAESNPYTHWTTANANLILNADTFKVLLLDADSLTIENDKGIYIYKRQRKFADMQNK